jgi:nicotinamidase-related amidase
MSSFSEERHAAALTVVARSFGIVAPSAQVRSVWDAAKAGPRNWQPAAKKQRALGGLRARLDPKHTALILLNLQRDFVDPAGGLKKAGKSIAHIEATVPRNLDLLHQVRRAGCMIIHAAASYEPSDQLDDLAGAAEITRLCRPGSWGAQVAAGFEPQGDEPVVACQRFSAFADTPLALLLRSNGIRTLVVAGVTTECSVESTVRDAAARDFVTIVAADSVASSDDRIAQHENSLRAMAHYFSLVMPSADITAQWATTPGALLRATA